MVSVRVLVKGDTMSEPTTTEVRRRPGGRSAKVRAAVQRATLELLDELDYDDLQLPDVAARAGVNKTTIYRRWPTKAHLVTDVIQALTESEVPTPDTGSLHGDLVALLTDTAAVLHTRVARAVLRAVIADRGDDPVVASTRTAFWNERFRRSTTIVERAIARGELPADTDARRLLEEAASPIYFRLLITGDTVDAQLIDHLARRASITGRQHASRRDP